MSNMEQIEQELRAYLETDKNLSSRDKFIHLKAIFDKHFAMEKTEHLLNIQDMRSIVDYAKGQFINTQLPMVISKKEIFPSEVPHILMIESTISHLNRVGILRKLAKFDK